MFSDGVACGWSSELPDSKDWIPGVIAFGEDGTAFEAKGGDDQMGAERWEKWVHEIEGEPKLWRSGNKWVCDQRTGMLGETRRIRFWIQAPSRAWESAYRFLKAFGTRRVGIGWWYRVEATVDFFGYVSKVTIAKGITNEECDRRLKKERRVGA